MFSTTCHVNIETHNLCNYTKLHKKCPASEYREPVTLPSNVVVDILDTLGRYSYGRGQSIAFYLYNEALIDPRMFQFIAYARRACPDACIIIGTNGWPLTGQLALELYHTGATYLLVSAYSDGENKRLEGVRTELRNVVGGGAFPHPVSFGIRRVKTLDERTDMSEADEGGRPCYAPLSEIIVRADGSVPLCCLDTDCKWAFGNVHEEGFESLVKRTHDRMKTLRTELDQGIRSLDICKRCFFVGRWRWSKAAGGDTRWEKDLL